MVSYNVANRLDMTGLSSSSSKVFTMADIASIWGYIVMPIFG